MFTSTGNSTLTTQTSLEWGHLPYPKDFGSLFRPSPLESRSSLSDVFSFKCPQSLSLRGCKFRTHLTLSWSLHLSLVFGMPLTDWVHHLFLLIIFDPDSYHQMKTHYSRVRLYRHKYRLDLFSECLSSSCVTFDLGRNTKTPFIYSKGR